MRFHTAPWMTAQLQPAVVYGVPLLWGCGVWGLARFMTTREKPFDVKRPMQVYNVAQIALCSYMVWGMAPCLGFPNFFGLNSPYDVRGEWFVFVHLLSKYLDWFDTLWIILKKNRKQLSFLHVYHHATIPMVWGYLLLNGVGSGTIRYGAWINSLTHVIMYSHYLWTSFGLKNPFKKMITTWQISQFYSCLFHAALVQCYETTETKNYAWLQLAYQSTMVYLFTFRLNWVPKIFPQFGLEKKNGNGEAENGKNN